MRPPSCTPAPSSVNRETPRAASSPMGAKAVPARPSVMVPATATSAGQSAPKASTSLATPAESIGGSVLGMATTAV